MTAGHDLVVVGASWGGLDAIGTLLGGLPAALDATIVVAQHRSPGSHPTAFRDLLRKATLLRVREPDDKAPLERGVVFVAPPDYHVYVEGDHLTLSTDVRVAYSRPSINVLFQSSGESFRDRCVGVVLTGANEDGADGLRVIADLGGAALVQDPATAARAEMPAAALAAVPGATVLPVEQMPAALVELCGVAKVVA